MEAFLGVFGKTVALALERMNVHHHWLCRILHLLECGDERFDVVALFYIQVVKAEALEVIVFALALRGSEFCKAPVKPAVVFGDGHLVVIYHHDKVRRVFACVVEAFECLAAAQGTIANHSDYIALFAQDIAGGGKPQRKAYRCRSVTYHKLVMFTFARFGIARNTPVLVGIQERLSTTRQNLVSVTLVRNIVDNLVLGGIKDIMQGDSPFHKPQIRCKMSTTFRNLVNQSRANFARQRGERFRVHLFYICRGLDFFYQHKLPTLELGI